MKYSKKQLKGLPTPNEYVVKDIYNYIRIMKCFNMESKYLYRGEPDNYYEITASGLRENIPFIKMQNDFKREIFHKLSIDERNNFLAFSQHHGIPTNLVDFTTFPLVALFFACQSVSKKDKLDNDFGFVYLIKDELIDITDIITLNNDDNLFNLLLVNENVLVKLYDKLMLFKQANDKKFYYYFKTLNEEWHYYFGETPFKRHLKVSFPKYNEGLYEFNIDFKFIENNKRLFTLLESKYGKLNLCVAEYLLMIRDFLTKVIENKEVVHWVNFLPNFVYKPLLTFERAINQRGVFVYQPYFSFTEEVYNFRVLMQQRIWPDIVVVIKNKNEILKDLDFIGINDKFIYSDFDHIAKYIKQSNLGSI